MSNGFDPDQDRHFPGLGPKQLAKFTLKEPIMTAADDKFCDIFPNLCKK